MPSEIFTTYFQAGPVQSADISWLRLERKLGLVSEAELDVHTPSFIEPDDLLGQTAHIAFGRGEPEHVFDGIIMSVETAATADDNDDRGYVHRIHVTSLMALLEHQVDCRIFQDKDVQEIVTQVLTELGIDANHQLWHTVGSYPKREYCVQYNESALDFVSRLLEEEGIYYWSDKGDGGDVIVFDDDSEHSDPIDGESAIVFRHGGGLNRAEDAIAVIRQRHKKRVGKVVYRDYDFKKPNFDMTVEAAGKDDKDLELYDYPGLYDDPAEGKRLARMRLEAFTAERATFEILAGCPRIVAGKSLEIYDAPNGLDGEYFITNAIHEFDRAVYKVAATLIPKKVKYRSPRRTPVPIIDGPQTAVIVAPPGSPAEEIHTDEHGRCKVKFHWDRYGKRDDSATFWMRVAQPQTSGSMILPRIGWEVIIEFLEGNPDRPIITGRVYNGKNMPPYALPEGKSRTSLQTNVSPGGGGTNEIRFEDKAGSEEIMMNAHKDTTLNTANNKKKSVGVNESRSVAVDSSLTVGGNQDVKITNGYLNTVGGSQSVSVGGNRAVEINAVYGLTVGGSSETSVGGNQMEMDGNPIQALLTLALKAATEAAQAAAAKQLQKLDAAVTAKVNQVMGPINQLESQVQAVSQGMDALANGDLGAAASTLAAASGLPTPAMVGRSLAGDGGAENAASAGADGPAEASGSARGEAGEGGEADGEDSGGVLHAIGLDAMVRGAIQSGSDTLGSAMGLGGGGGGGSSAANTAGPEGAVDGNSASDNTTGPGHAVNMCSSTHTEKIGSLKVAIAANGIHTTVAGNRQQDIGAARVELVAGTRSENCLANKTENALGLIVLSPAAEEETVSGSRATMVGGAILEKIGGSHTVTAGGLLTIAGAFHKVEASTAIKFECGGSSVTIDGSGVTIKAAAVTITAPKVILKGSVGQGI